MLFHMPGRWEISFDVRAGEEKRAPDARHHPQVTRLRCCWCRCWPCGPAACAAQQLLDWSPEEVRGVEQHGPWPPPAVRDPSNKVSGTAGRRLRSASICSTSPACRA